MYILNMLLKTATILLFFVFTGNVIKMLYLMGFHKTVWTHWPGPCRTVAPIEHGAEDIALTKDGLAIITSGIDLAHWAGGHTDQRISDAEGKLFAFDFNNPDKNATDLHLGIDFEFVPHGISIWESPEKDETRLFVVNHRREAETIEIFKLTGSVAEPGLEHVKSVQDALFTSINDVVATGPDSFYASNDGYLRYTAWRRVERYLTLPWGSVVYYDGKDTRAVISSSFEANGMDMSKDGRFVFISLPSDELIAMYDRTNNNSLVFHQNIPLGVHPDNIFVHPETGDLWSGVAAIAHLEWAAFADLDNLAPAMVIRIRPLGSKDRPFEQFKLYDVFRDDGHLMSTSSSAAVYRNRLLAGSIMDTLVYCEMKCETTLSRDVY